MPLRSRQVFLVVEPKFEWDAGAVKRRERAVKRAKVAAAEMFRTSPLDDNSSGSAEGRPVVGHSPLLGISFGRLLYSTRRCASAGVIDPAG